MEQTIFTIRPSMRPIIVLYSLVFLLFIFTIAASSSLIAIFSGVIALIAFIEVLILHIQRNFTIYTLTSESIRFRTGIIAKRETTIPLIKTQNVTFGFSIAQRLFGVGNVIIESAAEHIGGVCLRNIERPEEYAKQILETVKSQQKNTNQP
jgi:uncharacterized membrane protein YdbT with pleckstrin-like domain